MGQYNDFIIIDDDEINNKLCRKVIEKTYPNAVIADFTDPQEGFDYIVKKYAQTDSDEKAILLLDISMPVITAWDFLDMFEPLNERVKSRIKIHILSSSVNKNDMLRAQSNKNVEYYLIKPLTMESIRLIVHVLNRRQGLIT
jgi:CheY-like chemotaxis protein